MADCIDFTLPQSLSLQFGRIMGSSIPGARFGTTIVNIGDLNLDGYPDVAIGAPYEHGYGAVYIYNGWKEGLKTAYSQRIEARYQPLQPQGFGISISQAMDIDDNQYPDIVIGAYESDSAYLFRNNSPLVVGRDTFVSLNINVKNRDDEPAYLARVEINLPENVDIINVANCETKTNSSLMCDIGNPLNSKMETSLTVKLGLVKIKKKLEIEVIAKTDSMDSDLSNNRVLIALPLIYRGDIALQG
ncbi:hypothetical protein V5799_033471, partial [Amblyomma americanum]